MAKKILLENFEVGMELATPLKNKFGQIVFPANTILEEKHKRIMKTWGINEFNIVYKPESTDGLPTDYSSYNSVLSDRINWKPRNSKEENLLEMAVKYQSEVK